MSESAFERGGGGDISESTFPFIWGLARSESPEIRDVVDERMHRCRMVLSILPWCVTTRGVTRLCHASICNC